MRDRPLTLSVLLLLCLAGSGLPGGCAPSSPPEATREQPAAEPILRADFTDPNDSPWAAALLRHPRVHLAPGLGPRGETAILVDYVGYRRGSRRVVVRHPLPSPGQEMTLCYRVRFDEGFPFVRGGKLHGLGPDHPVTGGAKTRPDGWSARIMFKRQGGLATYLYTQDKESKWGVGQKADDFHFTTGRWHSVSIHVRVNSAPDKKDGFTHVYVDGRAVIKHENVRFRAKIGKKTLISQALFSTFHGGSSPRWAPVDSEGDYVTVHAHFAGLAVYKGRHVCSLTGKGRKQQ